MSHKYAVIYEQGPTSIGAYVPDLPGCVAVGKSIEEVQKLIRAAIQLHLAGLVDDGQAIPEPGTRCEYVDTTVPAAPYR
jgi:predicted RNase H-like HicB family nuclease